MVKRRRIVAAVTRARLLELAREFRISGLSGKPKEEIVQAISAKRCICSLAAARRCTVCGPSQVGEQQLAAFRRELADAKADWQEYSTAVAEKRLQNAKTKGPRSAIADLEAIVLKFPPQIRPVEEALALLAQ